jgi:exosortase family protein XrtF
VLPVSSPLPSASLHNRLITRFIVVATALLLLWFFGYEQWLAVDGRLDSLLCTNIADAGAALLRALGFTAGIASTNSQLLLLEGQPAVVVGPPCNGLVLYALFAGFVLAYPGPWMRKLWYIPLGMGLIWGLNVLRVAMLALNHQYAPRSLDFNHHYTFSFVVYACIFGLWMLWVRRLAGPLTAALPDRAHG